MDKYVVVLAAGRGSRMQSRDPNHSKVAYPLLDKPIINYVLDSIKPINPSKIVVVVGFGGEVTKSLVEHEADVVWQHIINGTGGAVLQAKPLLEGKKGLTLVVCGDTPLITPETINNVFRIHEKTGDQLTVVSMVVENPRGYGRIIREEIIFATGVSDLLQKILREVEKLIAKINRAVHIQHKTFYFFEIHLKRSLIKKRSRAPLKICLNQNSEESADYANCHDCEDNFNARPVAINHRAINCKRRRQRQDIRQDRVKQTFL